MSEQAQAGGRAARREAQQHGEVVGRAGQRARQPPPAAASSTAQPVLGSAGCIAHTPPPTPLAAPHLSSWDRVWLASSCPRLYAACAALQSPALRSPCLPTNLRAEERARQGGHGERPGLSSVHQPHHMSELQRRQPRPMHRQHQQQAAARQRSRAAPGHGDAAAVGVFEVSRLEHAVQHELVGLVGQRVVVAQPAPRAGGPREPRGAVSVPGRRQAAGNQGAVAAPRRHRRQATRQPGTRPRLTGRSWARCHFRHQSGPAGGRAGSRVQAGSASRGERAAAAVAAGGSAGARGHPGSSSTAIHVHLCACREGKRRR